MVFLRFFRKKSLTIKRKCLVTKSLHVCVFVLILCLFFCILVREGNLLAIQMLCLSVIYSSPTRLFKPYGNTVLSFSIHSVSFFFISTWASKFLNDMNRIWCILTQPFTEMLPKNTTRMIIFRMFETTIMVVMPFTKLLNGFTNICNRYFMQVMR